jgi:hypothetical protein
LSVLGFFLKYSQPDGRFSVGADDYTTDFVHAGRGHLAGNAAVYPVAV